MNRQLTFFDDESDRDLQAKRLARRGDPRTSHEAAEELVASGRAGKQCALILRLLETGPQSSSNLAKVAQKYTSRVSDLRKRGHNIVAYRQDGEWCYRLEE